MKELTINGTIKLVHRNGKKSEYYALVADLGYTRKYLVFGATDVAELVGVLPRDLPAICPLDSDVPVSLGGV